MHPPTFLLWVFLALTSALPGHLPNTTCTANPINKFTITDIYVFSHMPGEGWEVSPVLNFVYNTPDSKTSFNCSATNFPDDLWPCSDDHPEISFTYDIKPKILNVYRTCAWAAGLVYSNGSVPQSPNMTHCSLLAKGTHGPGTYCNSQGSIPGIYSNYYPA